MSLALWLQIKDQYDYTVMYVGSELVTAFKDLNCEGISWKGKDTIQATFRPLRISAEILIDVSIHPSAYTFNTPTTIGIMAALFPFIRRRRRAYIEALIIFFSLHVLTVFSLEAAQLARELVARRVDETGGHISFNLFLRHIMGNLVTKSEPFLIGVYIYLRFKA
ncbi:MAG TPA: hypothetical protein VMU21_02150 [Thermodesulfovibrionales bacterium]|nr:hypothetical protein [Thermodesulfovibrionales bacterium]